MVYRYFLVACFLAAQATFVSRDAVAQAPRLELRPGDRIVFIGNTFAERFRHFGYFETLLVSRFPDYDLTFRNMGWSADEVALRPRPLNFGDIHMHLTDQRADVIFVCFGANESFHGESGLGQFKDDFTRLVRDLLDHRYNGESPPRLVVVSPIPQEPFEAMPDVSARNNDVRLYSETMAAVCQELAVPFLDLFTPLTDLYQSAPDIRLTFNGVHLTAFGYWVVAQYMMDGLGFAEERPQIDIHARENALNVKGPIEASLEGDTEKLGLRLRFTAPPAPPPPHGARPPTQLVDHMVTLRIRDLPPGRYELRVDGQTLLTASRDVWAAGVPLYHGAAFYQAESLRRTIVYKNQLFFDRWRAVNGYYIYGGRKEPFGVISFPPEMRRFDQLAAEHDAKIHELVKQSPEQIYEIVRVKD